MGSSLDYPGHSVHIGNWELDQACADAISVATSRNLDQQQTAYVEKLKHAVSGFFSGYCPDFAQLFSTQDERLFWSDVWQEAANTLLDTESPHGVNIGRRIFINYWCHLNVRWVHMRDNISQEVRLEIPEAERIDWNQLNQEEVMAIELREKIRKADKRGRMDALVNPKGMGRCPHCYKIFRDTDSATWDGDRHLPCLTRLRLVSR